MRRGARRSVPVAIVLAVSVLAASVLAGCGEVSGEAEAARIAEEAVATVEAGEVDPVDSERFEAAAEVVERGLPDNPSREQRAAFRAAAEDFTYGMLHFRTTGEAGGDDLDLDDPDHDEDPDHGDEPTAAAYGAG